MLSIPPNMKSLKQNTILTEVSHKALESKLARKKIVSDSTGKARSRLQAWILRCKNLSVNTNFWTENREFHGNQPGLYRKRGDRGLKPPNNFENNGYMLQSLIKCIVHYLLRTMPPQSAAASYSPAISHMALGTNFLGIK